MSQTRKPASFDMVTRVAPDSGPATPASDEPFRLLLLADFSGRASRGLQGELSARRPRRVDRDDLQKVFSALAPELELSTRAAGVRLRLALRSLEDLHPDSLWEGLDVFRELRSLRARLSNPETFAEAAAEISGVAPRQPEPPKAPARKPVELPADQSFDLLEESLRATDGSASGGTGSELVDEILRDLVIPRVPATPGQADLIAGVDAAAADEMRALLMAPELRRLEAAWRATELLVRRIETDEHLQIWLLDVSAEELVQDLVAHEDPRSSELWRAAFEPDAGGGGARWSAWAALDLTFGASPGQAALLARFAHVAGAAGAPFLAAASGEIAGSASLPERPDPDDWVAPPADAARAWSALRALPDASWLLLALPRVLLRAPYGSDTNPLERFRFEELGSPPEHEGFLWGSGALAPALALAQEFSRRGAEMSVDGSWELDRLPAPVFRDADGEVQVKPCAEVVISERTSQALRSAGLLPLATVRDSDRIVFGPLTSVGGTPLAGRWNARR